MKEPRQNDKRRDFLRDSSLMLASAIPVGLAVTAEALAGSRESLRCCRLGLVGCGKRGVRAVMDALAFSPGCRLIAVADAFGDRLQQSHRSLKSRFPSQFEVMDDHRFTGPHAVESLCQTTVDAVVLAAPPRLLSSMVEATVRAHKHVFVEMPVAIDAAGVERFLAAGELAREQGTVLAVGLQRRSSSDYVQTIQQLQAGAIGRLLQGSAFCSVPAQPAGHRSRQHSLIEHKLRNWRAYEDFSGGPIVEEFAHQLDVFNWTLGEHPWMADQMVGCERGNELSFEYHYRDGFRLTCRLELGGATYNSSEWIFGSRGACDIGQGRIYDLNDRLIWRTEAPRDGFVTGMQRFIEAVASRSSLNEASIAGECTMSALLGRICLSSASRCRWSDLQCGATG